MDEALRKADKRDGPSIPKLMPPQPCRMNVVGSSGSGKTHWLCKTLMDKTLGMSTWDNVIWLGPTRSLQQPKLKLLKDKWKQYITFLPVDDSVPIDRINALLDHAVRNNWSTLVVADDLMNLPKKQRRFLNDLFCHGRHANVSVAELNQTIYSGNKTNRLNSTVFCLFNTQRGEISKMAKEICSTKAKAQKLVECYSKIVEDDPHGCLILDLNGKSTKDWPCRARHTEWSKFIPSLYQL